MAAYARSVSLLAHPTVVYARFISLLAYPTAVYVHWHTQLPCTQGSKLYVPNGCAPKINIIASVSNGCVCTLIKALSSIFPMVMYPRFMLFFLSVPKSAVRYWHTQLHCTQGSKLYVPNFCAPKINIIAVPGDCVHKIHITTSVPSSCVHWQ